MHPDRPLDTRSPARIALLGSGVLALVITTALTAPFALAADIPADTATAPSAPPSYPDDSHVFNGCHLSTIRYLARYLSQYPGERGEPLVINLRNADGAIRTHTIALISWQGQSWGRDEYFGVFALRCPFEAQPNFKRLISRAESRLEQHAQMLVRAEGMPLRPEAPERLSSEQRIREVRMAGRIIPFPAAIFWVRSGQEELPLAFFRPSERQVAVYDPQHGTCLAECSIRDDARVVSLVAARLGYQTDGIRRESSIADGALLAVGNTAR